MTGEDRSSIADPSLAPAGEEAIAWAKRYSPVLDGFVRERLGAALSGRRIAVVIHLGAKTAFLATILADAGAQVVVASSNPFSTRNEIAAALVARGIEVHAKRGATPTEWNAELLAVADTAPEFVIDDGVELTMRMLRYRPEAFAALQGVSEETTTGVARLRALEAAGRLTMPAMAANDAACKHLFDNRYGTGQSTLQAILSLTNLRLPGARLTVVGYGWVGRGIAAYAKGMGARTTVVEIDPIRALEAHVDGHTVAPIDRALSTADLVVTATGGVRAVGAVDLENLNDGVVLANAGHHDLEIDTAALAALADGVEQARPGIDRYRFGAKSVHVLAGGSPVNIAGGMGHPVGIMDLSFAVQVLSCLELVAGSYPAGVHVLPAAVDADIARAKLASVGVELGQRRADQIDPIDDYLEMA